MKAILEFEPFDQAKHEAGLEPFDQAKYEAGFQAIADEVDANVLEQMIEIAKNYKEPGIPKQKAEELFDKYYDYLGMPDCIAKECTLIAVDEIIQGYEFDSLEINHKRIIDNINFWYEVKQEIEKL